MIGRPPRSPPFPYTPPFRSPPNPPPQRKPPAAPPAAAHRQHKTGTDKTLVCLRARLQPCRKQHASKRRLRSAEGRRDRKSTRLNSSHQIISYAVFCLKKKKD